jgi:hypothetical protein
VLVRLGATTPANYRSAPSRHALQIVDGGAEENETLALDRTTHALKGGCIAGAAMVALGFVAYLYLFVEDFLRTLV